MRLCTPWEISPIYVAQIYTKQYLILQNCVFSQTFYPNLPIFYTDISAISVTSRNSENSIGKHDAIAMHCLTPWNILIWDHALQCWCSRILWFVCLLILLFLTLHFLLTHAEFRTLFWILSFKFNKKVKETSLQASSYARLKLRPTDLIDDWQGWDVAIKEGFVRNFVQWAHLFVILDTILSYFQ